MCYLIGEGELNFTEATAACHSMGAFLPEPRTEALQNVMKSDFFPRYFWLGLTDVDNEGQFVWETDKTPVSWTNWKTNEPSGRTDYDCVRNVYQSTYWQDFKCVWTYPYVCQKGKYYFIKLFSRFHFF